MATTTNYGWTTPDDTALVKDGAAAIRTLGSSVDTTTKNLNPETTLGDLAYRSSTANVKTRLALGTANQVLRVNSGATAPEWATLAASSPASASAQVNAQESTTSTSFTDLTTAGPAVTLTTGTKALVIVDCQQSNSNNGVYSVMGCEVTGASSVSPAVNDSSGTYAGTAFATRSKAIRYSGLTAGSNTFTAKYAVEGNTGTWLRRNIFVMDLGS